MAMTIPKIIKYSFPTTDFFLGNMVNDSETDMKINNRNYW